MSSAVSNTSVGPGGGYGAREPQHNEPRQRSVHQGDKGVCIVYAGGGALKIAPTHY